MKRDIRKKVLGTRKSLEIEDVKYISKEISLTILKWDIYKNSKSIMLYSAIKNEVDLSMVASDAIKNNKELVYPKTIRETVDIIPCIVSNLEELQEGEYGILEPSIDKSVEKNKIDTVFVPGVAYDINGYRIGYGAGYYDRFLRDYNGIKVGICFSFQIVDDVYKDEHDIKMDYIITEKGILTLI